MDEALLRNEPLLFWYWTAVGWLSYPECSAAIAARKSTLEVGFITACIGIVAECSCVAQCWCLAQ